MPTPGGPSASNAQIGQHQNGGADPDDGQYPPFATRVQPKAENHQHAHIPVIVFSRCAKAAQSIGPSIPSHVG
jgi:hypothetical protein